MTLEVMSVQRISRKLESQYTSSLYVLTGLVAIPGYEFQSGCFGESFSALHNYVWLVWCV